MHSLWNEVCLSFTLKISYRANTSAKSVLVAGNCIRLTDNYSPLHRSWMSNLWRMVYPYARVARTWGANAWVCCDFCVQVVHYYSLFCVWSDIVFDCQMFVIPSRDMTSCQFYMISQVWMARAWLCPKNGGLDRHLTWIRIAKNDILGWRERFFLTFVSRPIEAVESNPSVGVQE